MDISLNPGEPCPPEHTRAVAAAIPEAVRVLNHATISRPGDALGGPSTVDAVIRDLATAAQRLPQLFEQLRRWLDAEYDAGRIEGAGIMAALAYLDDSAAAAAGLEDALKAAASGTSTLTVPYSGDEDQED